MKANTQRIGSQGGGGQGARGSRKTVASPIDGVLRAVRPAMALMFGFSLFSNVLRLTTPLFVLQIVDRVLSSRNEDTLMFLYLIALAACISGALIVASIKTYQTRLGSWVEATLIEPVLRAGLDGRLTEQSMGPQTVKDLGQVRGFFASGTFSNLCDLPWLPIFVTVLFVMNAIVGLIAIGFAIILLILALIHHAVTRDAQDRSTEEMSVSSQALSRGFQNSDLLHAMGMMPNFMRSALAKTDTARHAQDTASERGSTLSAFIKGFRQIAQITVLGTGAYLVILGDSSTGIMMAGSLLLNLALSPVDQASPTWRGVVNTRQALARLRRQVSVGEDVPQAGRVALAKPHGALAMQQALYFPQNRKRPAIKPISFSVAPGEMVGIIGPAAAGKTVLCRMAVGLVPPNAGSVQLDGVDLHEWIAAGLGRYVGYLPQDHAFVAGTLGDNIARLEPDSLDRSAALREAVGLVDAQDTVLNLAQGFDTDIDQANAILSRSEIQKISLARAFYGKPQLIVLDEPATFLDRVGEAALATALTGAKERGATILIVSQRPSLMKLCDRLMLLRDGVMDAYDEPSTVLERLRNGGDSPEAGRRMLRLASS